MTAREKYGVAAPFGGPTSSGMLTLHCPPKHVHGLASFLREHGAEAVSVAALDYVYARDNPLYDAPDRGARPRHAAARRKSTDGVTAAATDSHPPSRYQPIASSRRSSPQNNSFTDHKGRRAENSQRSGGVGFGQQVVVRFGRSQAPARGPGSCPTSRRARGQIGFASGLFAGLKPAPVRRAHEVGAPALAHADNGHQIGRRPIVSRDKARATSPAKPYIGRAALDVTPHVRAFLRACRRTAYASFLEGSEADETAATEMTMPVDRSTSASRITLKSGIRAAHREPEVDRTFRHVDPPAPSDTMSRFRCQLNGRPKGSWRWKALPRNKSWCGSTNASKAASLTSRSTMPAVSMLMNGALMDALTETMAQLRATRRCARSC